MHTDHPEQWTLKRPEPQKAQKPPEPDQPKNTRQLAMFDAGRNDLPALREKPTTEPPNASPSETSSRIMVLGGGACTIQDASIAF